MISHLTEGFLLGLATGTSCLATCGPIYAPFLMHTERQFKKSLGVLFEISMGRCLAYLGIGAIAGTIGAAIAVDHREWFTLFSYLLFSTFLILSAVRTHRTERGCAAHRWYSFAQRPFFLGILTGINICPPFLIAFTRAFDLSGAISGMLFFVAFFAGTTLFLLPLSLFGIVGQQKTIRLVGRVASVLIAAWFLGLAVGLIFDKIAPSDKQQNAIGSTINLMDSSLAIAVVQDSANPPTGVAALMRQRSGSVSFISDTNHLSRTGIIFIDDAIGKKFSNGLTLRSKGRFICILPEFVEDSLQSIARADSLARFLNKYRFKLDADSGTIYRLAF